MVKKIMKCKIKEIINEKDSVLAFDVDGVLAVMEFGEYNHFLLDEEWDKYVKENINVYTDDKVSNKMKKFLSKRNLDNIYVITKVNGDNEINHKKDYLKRNYGIYLDHIYTVSSDDEKKDKMLEISKKYPNLNHKKIVMIDDNYAILSDIMTNTDFTTAHISSFLDI